MSINARCQVTPSLGCTTLCLMHSSNAAATVRTPSTRPTGTPPTTGGLVSKSLAVDSSRQQSIVERFAAHGRAYQWREGAGLVVEADAATRPARRNSMPTFFTRTVVAQLERRGARGLIFHAAASDGTDAGDVHWITWRAASDASPVWGLYLAASKLERRATSAAANDTMVLIAWGDGLALAWADERETARLALRAALRVPPTWLARGLRSADPTFPVRIEPSDDDADVAPRIKARCVALAPPVARRDDSARVAPRAVLLGMLKEWQRTHARESTG